MAAKQPHISSRDPDQVFELMKQIGSGSYGSVHKVCTPSVFSTIDTQPRSQARIIKSGKMAAIKMINMEDGEPLIVPSWSRCHRR